VLSPTPQSRLKGHYTRLNRKHGHISRDNFCSRKIKVMRSVSNFKYTLGKIIAKNAFVKELNKIIILWVPVPLGTYGGNPVSMGGRALYYPEVLKS